MKLITVTKKEPVGVEMSVKEFLKILEDNSVVLEFVVGNTLAAFHLEPFGVDLVDEKGGRIFLSTGNSSGAFSMLEE